MCKVKSGTSIKSQQDVQNLVIGLLFRQQQAYRKEQILILAEYYMRGSSVVMNRGTLMDIISKNLDILYRNDRVRCKNGYYTPRVQLGVPYIGLLANK